MSEARNPYGDGKASERIVAAYEHLAFGGTPPQPFGPDYSRLAVYTASGYELDIESAEIRPQAEDEQDEEAREQIWQP
jgi:hypothetical protein